MTHKSKISCLPRNIRDELNARLENGVPGKDIVAWLRGLCLADALSQFGGALITEQNLSDWRNGPFLVWQRHKAARERVDRFIDLSDGLNYAANDENITYRLSSLLAAELASETQQILASSSDPSERFRCISQAVRSLHVLRNSDHTALRAHIQRDEWDRRVTQIEDAAAAKDRDREEQAIANLTARASFTDGAPADMAALAALLGKGPGALAMAVRLVNERRASAGKPPLPSAPDPIQSEPSPASPG